MKNPLQKKSPWPIILVGVLLIALAVAFGWWLRRPTATTPVTPIDTTSGVAPLAAADLRNADVLWEDGVVHLVNGSAQGTDGPGSDEAAQESHVLQDAPVVVGDISADGQNDVFGVLATNTGGTGVFVSIVGLLGGVDGGGAVRSVMIGDRIIVESLEIDNGVLVVRYLDREPDEAMVTIPTVAKERRLSVDRSGAQPRLTSAFDTLACSGQNVTVNAPVANSTVTFPLTVTVVVDNSNDPSCNWGVFEAEAGIVKLKNALNVVLSAEVLSTTMNWMTTGPVTFTTVLSPSPLPPSGPLTLEFVENDPSGEGTVQTKTVPISY